ncbi:MAG TPA: hypothetical protein VFD75_11900, partial [Pyrinomonadaceae bacterium]|nr:hypothetical protein [Pyrinomonadaceae bacterium]
MLTVAGVAPHRPAKVLSFWRYLTLLIKSGLAIVSGDIVAAINTEEHLRGADSQSSGFHSSCLQTASGQA